MHEFRIDAGVKGRLRSAQYAEADHRFILKQRKETYITWDAAGPSSTGIYQAGSAFLLDDSPSAFFDFQIQAQYFTGGIWQVVGEAHREFVQTALTLRQVPIGQGTLIEFRVESSGDSDWNDLIVQVDLDHHFDNIFGLVSTPAIPIHPGGVSFGCGTPGHPKHCP